MIVSAAGILRQIEMHEVDSIRFCDSMKKCDEQLKVKIFDW